MLPRKRKGVTLVAGWFSISLVLGISVGDGGGGRPGMFR